MRSTIFAVALLLPVAAYARPPSLPDPFDTPGAVNPAVNQANIGSTICQPGWTRTIRPGRAYTNALKRRQLTTWQGYAAAASSEDFEEDHLIPLDLGGAPDDQHNLWPQPRISPDGWNADRKDGLERVLKRLVCDGRLPLALAQRAIALDWTAAYRQFVKPRR